MTPQLGALALTLAGMGAGCAAWAAIIIAWRRLRGWLRGLPALWDDGDGQGGVPVTRPLPLAGLVIDPELERHAAWRAAQLARTAGATAVCTRCARGDTGLPCACRADCYAAYCMGGFE